jgi:hypothetical protein
MGGTANLGAAVSLLDRVIEVKTAAWGRITHRQLPRCTRRRMHWCGWVDRQPRRAVALYDRVIEIKTAALGADHPDTAVTLHEKASALVQMGGSANLAAAVALYDRVIESTRQRWERITHRHSHHAAREGECVGADGWIGQPRRSGSAVRPRHRDQDGSAGSGSPIDSHHAAPEGECVGADGWIDQPRRSVALYDRVIEINTAALGADHPSRQPPRCTRRRMRWCRWVDRPTSPRR